VATPRPPPNLARMLRSHPRLHHRLRPPSDLVNWPMIPRLGDRSTEAPAPPDSPSTLRAGSPYGAGSVAVFCLGSKRNSCGQPPRSVPPTPAAALTHQFETPRRLSTACTRSRRSPNRPALTVDWEFKTKPEARSTFRAREWMWLVARRQPPTVAGRRQTSPPARCIVPRHSRSASSNIDLATVLPMFACRAHRRRRRTRGLGVADQPRTRNGQRQGPRVDTATTIHTCTSHIHESLADHVPWPKCLLQGRSQP